MFGKIFQWDIWAWVLLFGKLLNWKLFSPNILKLFRLSIWHLLVCHMLKSKLLNSKLLNFVMKSCWERRNCMPGCPGAVGRSSQCTGAGTGWAEHTGMETCTRACSWATAFSGSALEEERVQKIKWIPQGDTASKMQCLAQSSSISDWFDPRPCILDFMGILLGHDVKPRRNGLTPGPQGSE